jgi:copper chaperone
VKEFDVKLDKQTAEVTTKDDSLTYETVLNTIKKTGKKVKTGEADGKEMPIEAPAAAA